LDSIIQKDAQESYPLVKMEGTGCTIDDVFASDDTTAPISSGLFTVSSEGGPLTYTYKYHEMKIILEGEGELKDADGDIVHDVKKGDVIYIKKGTTVVFSSKSSMKAFYVGQRALRDF